MLGRELSVRDRAPVDRDGPGPDLLVATGLVSRRLNGLDLCLRGGEVTGITGPTDSGYEDVPVSSRRGPAGWARRRRGRREQAYDLVSSNGPPV